MTDKIVTNNKRIVEFYKKYKCFDFDTVNISVINMLETVITDTQNTISNSTLNQLLSMFSEYHSKLDNIEKTNTNILKQFDTNKTDIKDTLLHIRELIMNQKNDLENMISSKLSTIKQQYIDDIKILLQLNEQTTISSISAISSKIDTANISFIDKLQTSIFDFLPKMSEPISKQVQQSIDGLKTSLSLDNLKLLDTVKSYNTTELLNSFINNFNNRYTELVKNINEPIIGFITCSEERLKTNIETVKTSFNSELILSSLDNNTNKIQSSITNIDKTDIIISTLENYITRLQSNITSIDKTDSLKTYISSELLSMFNTFKSNSTTDNINSFISSFDMRLTQYINNIQTPLIQSINTLEDRLQSNITTIKNSIDNNQSITEQVNKNLNDHLNKYKSSTTKGQLSENRLFNDLTRIYTDAEIVNITNINRSGDILFVRNNKPKIRFENKDYSYNVPETEVDKFKRDLNECNDAHGIFISQSSGIANRADWSIEIINNYVILFIHNANYDIDKIILAVKIIDLLDTSIISNKSNKNEVNNTSISITEDDIRKINNDLISIMNVKTRLLEHLNTSYIKSKEIIDDIKIPHLETILLNYNSNNPTKYTCDFCSYEGKTSRALSMHLYHSHKKQTDDINYDTNENTSITISPNNENENISDTTSLTITKKTRGRKKKE